MSSSTTGKGRSRHYMSSLKHYETTAQLAFELRFGPLSQYTFAGILPNYKEQGDSSLIYMVDHFMKHSASGSGYYLHEAEPLKKLLLQSENLVLFGVSFALLDLANSIGSEKEDLTIIETGGMKGRKKEITREELYAEIRKAFPNAHICSEYGMTELTSQAYSNENGILQCPPWMKVLVRDDTDPFSVSESGKGALNIIDLANQDSCAFIATDDLAEVYEDGSFRILGRLDSSDQRGCALLIA